MDGRLTPDDVKALNRPFLVNEHEFRDQGNVTFTYVAEEAVTQRLDEVDPNWSLKPVTTYQRDRQIICILEMTVGGTTRVGTGMAQIMTKSGDGGAETNEAEKGAATDALRRCARLFGVGRYLLNTPKSVKDEKSLTAWLGTLNNTNGNKMDTELTWPHPTLIEQVKEKAMRVFDIKVWSDEFLCGKKWTEFESGKAAGAAIAACVENLRNPIPQPAVTTASGEPIDTATGEILDARRAVAENPDSGAKSDTPPAEDDKPTPKAFILPEWFEHVRNRIYNWKGISAKSTPSARRIDASTIIHALLTTGDLTREMNETEALYVLTAKYQPEAAP